MKIRQHESGSPLAHPLTWLATASGGWLALVVASPFAPVPLALMAYTVGAVVCHQIPDRSFHIGVAQFAVCARCTGIYAGAAASFMWQALVAGPEPGDRTAPHRDDVAAARLWLLGGALPTVVTVLLEQAGLWQGSNVLRAVAGAPLGVVVALVAGRAARKLDRRKFQQSEPGFPRRAKQGQEILPPSPLEP
jgi:uncharacterized membrane protein